MDFSRNHADSAAVHQRFAQKALVKNQRAVDRGNAGLVAAVFHAFTHAFQHAAGVQQARGQGLVVEGRGKAEHVCIADKFRAHARAHRIAVDAHNTRKRTAVGVQSRRAVVGFYLDAGIVAVDEGDDARVVLEHGLAVVIGPHAFTQNGRGVANAGLVKVVHHFVAVRVRVSVIDARGENFVLAVLGPGLGQHFHFHVSGVAGQAHGLAPGHFAGGGELVANAVHFLEVQGPGIGAAGLGEVVVVHAGQGDGVHRVVGFACDLGSLRFKAGVGLPFLAALDAVALNERVAEQVARQHVHLIAGQRCSRIIDNAVLHGGVHAQAVAGDVQHHCGGIAGGAGFVVGHAGTKAHFHIPVRFGLACGQGLKRGRLQDGVVPDAFVQQPSDLGFIEAFGRKDLDLTHGPCRQVESLEQMLGRLAALCIVQSGVQAGFHPVEHWCFLVRLQLISFCRAHSRPCGT